MPRWRPVALKPIKWTKSRRWTTFLCNPLAAAYKIANISFNGFLHKEFPLATYSSNTAIKYQLTYKNCLYYSIDSTFMRPAQCLLMLILVIFLFMRYLLHLRIPTSSNLIRRHSTHRNTRTTSNERNCPFSYLSWRPMYALKYGLASFLVIRRYAVGNTYSRLLLMRHLLTRLENSSMANLSNTRRN